MPFGCLEKLLAVRECVHQVEAIRFRPTEQPFKMLPALDQR
jgi:hypothetical protein